MPKKAAKKAVKKSIARRAAKPAKPAPKAKTSKASPKKLAPKTKTAKPTLRSTAPTAIPDDGRLTFNHAMIYVKDVNRALGFYRDLLGFKLIEDFRFDGTPVYARLRAPGGDGTIALHQAGPSRVAGERRRAPLLRGARP